MLEELLKPHAMDADMTLKVGRGPYGSIIGGPVGWASAHRQSVPTRSEARRYGSRTASRSGMAKSKNAMPLRWMNLAFFASLRFIFVIALCDSVSLW